MSYYSFSLRNDFITNQIMYILCTINILFFFAKYSTVNFNDR